MSLESTTNLRPSTIKGLKSLIEINLDSAKGFAQAADKIESPELAVFFRECGSRRDRFAAELERAVAVSGGKPDDSGSIAGTVHRWWLGLRGAVEGGDEHALLAEAERGEDAIKERYETVLKDTAGSPLNAVLQAQYESVKRDHDTIREMRDARS